MDEKGRKKIFRDKQTMNNVALLFLDAKVFSER